MSPSPIAQSPTNKDSGLSCMGTNSSDTVLQLKIQARQAQPITQIPTNENSNKVLQMKILAYHTRTYHTKSYK